MDTNGYNFYAQNDAPNHTYSQNIYNMFGGHNPLVDDRYSQLRRYGTLTGLVLIASVVMQTVIGTLIGLSPMWAMYMNDVTYYHAVSIIAQFAYTFLPFFALYLFSKREDKKEILVFDLPKSKELYILALFAGFMFCVIGNSATSSLSVLFSFFEIEFNSGMEGLASPTSALGIILNILNFAVAPALFEEFAFRGVLLQPLRKYGDWFAIFASSFAFAILHGNMVQIPFAFIVGVALGYFCIKTQSIWTSVSIHFLNNLYSVIMTMYFEKNPETGMFTYYILTASAIFIGAIAMVIFKKNCHHKLRKDTSILAKHGTIKKFAFVCAPSMIVSLFIAVDTSLSLATVYSASGRVLLIVLGTLLMYFLFKWTLIAKKDPRLKPRRSYTVSMVLTAVLGGLAILSVFGISG
ncbi:MAG: CPBP family intramembrane metalloprotease [Clostridia bacterium]|nr:CPBP family intramembrane metalloprotease [Clostridia bacterium]